MTNPDLYVIDYRRYLTTGIGYHIGFNKTLVETTEADVLSKNGVCVNAIYRYLACLENHIRLLYYPFKCSLLGKRFQRSSLFQRFYSFKLAPRLVSKRGKSTR